MGQSLPPLQPLGESLLGSPGAVPLPAPRAAAGGSRIGGPQTQHLSMSTELIALVGLRELASSLVPGARLETTGDIARLLTRLHDLVETFCRFLIPLRDASSRLPGAPRRSSASSTGRQVERTTDPAALAALLLDWRTRDDDSTRVVDELLADIVTRHAGLIQNVLGGIGALLAEISPDAIETSVKEDAPMGAVFGRHRALWQAYRERFDEVTTESRQLELVFGVGPAGGRPRDPRSRG
jgi:hypothetical protein